MRVTLYRDHHAWCPYCQKVWLWLEERRIPYRIGKVTMVCYGEKESWYRRLVPSGMLPALALDGRLITESDRILEALELAANEGRLTKGEHIDWKHFIFGCIAGAVPWIAIFSIVWAYSAQEGLPAEAQIPGFVYVIIASLFVAFNIFAITMVLQYGKVGRWKDYLVGEKTYMVLSLVAKSLLAWQVWSGTLRPQ